MAIETGAAILGAGALGLGGSIHSAWSGSRAMSKANKYQLQGMREQMAFNAAEAARHRDWSTWMSNTAHRREVRDLRKAGLNPILSATGGAGAPVGVGSSASITNPNLGESVNSAIAARSATAGIYESMSRMIMNLAMAEKTKYEANSASLKYDKDSKHYEGTKGFMQNLFEGAPNWLKGMFIKPAQGAYNEIKKNPSSAKSKIQLEPLATTRSTSAKGVSQAKQNQSHYVNLSKSLDKIKRMDLRSYNKIEQIIKTNKHLSGWQKAKLRAKLWYKSVRAEK